MSIFEFATRAKLRFTSSRGDLTLEQLWDIPLRTRDEEFNLDAIAKAAHRKLREQEESFIETTKTTAHVRHETALEIIKHVIAVKLAEEAAATTRAARRQEKEALLRILAERQAGELNALSVKELQERIAALPVD